MIIEDNVLITVDNFDIKNGTFEIPASVTRIGYRAFTHCSQLTSIEIPTSVTSIGYLAFYGCHNLTSVTFAENSQLKSIGNGAFADCSNLTSVTFAENSQLTSIGKYAFIGCSKLTKVTFAENNQLKSIGDYAFWDCHNLTSITIPASVEEIGLSAFFDCGKLKSLINNYKAFLLEDDKLIAQKKNKEYKLGHKSYARGELKCCKNGLHYCTNIFDIFNYYCGEYGKDFVIALCDVSDKHVGNDEDSKHCARWIIPRKILTREEVIRIMNREEL